MNPSPKHFIIIAGEASGDMHAAHLVTEIKKLNPNITFSGLGGQNMQQAGVELYTDMTRLAVIGFIEVIKHYSEIKKIFNLTLKKVRDTNSDAVILVDYPGFNLRLARKLKKMNVKVIYYISPQVWAWKESRVKQIKKVVDQMLVLFSFEKEFYARHGMEVDLVGHPLIDTVKADTSRENVLDAVNFTSNKLTIGILPGSRDKEIETLLPPMLEAAAILNALHPHIQFLVSKAPTIKKEKIDRFVKDPSLPLAVTDLPSYDVIHACDMCIVASGTATLETAILEKPMVVVYKTSLLTWVLAKMLVKIPFIGLVNIVAGKKIVPECVQFQATGKHIAEELAAIFTNELKVADIKSNLRKVKTALGAPGASQRAAEKIIANL